MSDPVSTCPECGTPSDVHQRIRELEERNQNLQHEERLEVAKDIRVAEQETENERLRAEGPGLILQEKYAEAIRENERLKTRLDVQETVIENLRGRLARILKHGGIAESDSEEEE